MNDAINDITILARPHIKKYFEKIQEDVSEQYVLAKKMRSKGFDISSEVEMTPAVDLADRAETLIGLPGLAKRYRELSKNNKDRMEVYFQLFKEIIEQKWCNIPNEQKRLEIGIKACLLIQTEGVVVAPLDGLPKIEINNNPDGSKFVDIYFAGPIRAAGGSSTVIPLILGDYGRQLLGLEKYKPTKSEVERYVEEVGIYQTEVVSRQYVVPDSEIRIIVENCPVCVNGTPTEEVEVSVNKDLERIPSNKIRGGVGLVISEGLALKAMWVMDKAKKYAGLDWSFLEKIIKVEKKQSKIEIKPNMKILDGLAAGRPILAYPSRVGGFRLRYGRGRNTGIMAKAINPAGMIVFDEFIAVGTHGKIERPGKATQFFPCDTIDGPIVLLANGSVEKIDSLEHAEEIKNSIKKILFIGDLLVSYGDFRKSAHPLLPVGYVEEWWRLDLEKIVNELKEKNSSELNKLNNIGLKQILKNPFNIDEQTAVLLSEKINVPLHPKYIHYYNVLNKKEINLLHNFFLSADLAYDNNTNFITKIILENNSSLKSLLEKIGLPHKLISEKIVIEEFAFSLSKTFSLEKKVITSDLNKSLESSVIKSSAIKSSAIEVSAMESSVIESSINPSSSMLEKNNESALDYLNQISSLIIKDKSGTFIGARMGRPEQAKKRQMKGNPHVLFPIGLSGGSIRSINKAITTIEDSNSKISVEIAQYINPQTKQKTFCHYDFKTSSQNILLKNCFKCNESFSEEKCPRCGSELRFSGEHEIDLKKMLDTAKNNLKLPVPDLVKGVVGMISDTKEAEPLEKGILRARHKVHIFRDGTSRFELLNATITHFKPKEINMTVEKAIELGYNIDYLGEPLVDENQLLELFPQDIIVNSSCGDWMLEVSRFVDDELQFFYKEKPFYNAKTREDLIGQLVLGLAPHTSAGVTARVIGYTQARLGFGHPYFVCAKRRNVDGDQDSVMLLMDGLLNFSQKFLANRNGGKMDAPIVFTTIISPTEIDDEVFEMETCDNYSLEFYETASKIVEPFLNIVPIIKNKLETIDQYNGIGFTHNTNVFDEGPKTSKYIQLKTMEEKIQYQNTLQKKIFAVDSKDCLERVMGSHFLPDIIGNARAFSRQTFRCTTCNEKYRRIPLSGICYKCGKNTLILTIHQGSVRKYLKIAQNLARQENLSDYLIQRLEMIEKEIDSIFKDDHSKQKGLFDFV